MKLIPPLLVFLFALLACRPEAHREALFEGKTMGSTWSLRSIDPPSTPPQVQARLDAFEAIFSTWRADSEISRFNDWPAHQPFPASPPMVEAYRTAAELHRKTHGAFDPTVGPLVAAFGFGPPALANPDAVPCFDAILCDPETATLTKSRPGATLDFTALVEGLAMDAISIDLHSAGHHNFLFEIGGEMKGIGPGPEGKGWSVGIQNPGAPRGVAMSLVSLRNEALGTSGTYVQHDGPRSHLIDPRTRQPVAHQTVAVSVIAPEGIRADAWATALMILGEAEGRPLAEREHLEALFVNRAPHQEANASWVVPPANGSPEESSR